MASPDTPPSRSPSTTAVAVCLGGILAVVVCLVLYRIRAIFLPFMIGLFIAYVMDPILAYMEGRGWSRSAAVWTVTGTAVAVLVIVALLIVPPVVGQIQSLALNFGDHVERIESLYDDATARMLARAETGDAPSEAATRLRALLDEASESATEAVPAALKKVGAFLLGSLSSVLVVALVPIITFHFLKEFDPFRESVMRIVPEGRKGDFEAITHKVNAMLGSYLRGLTVVCILVAIASTCMLTVLDWTFGMEYALVIGLLTGVTYAVPYIGATLAAVAAGVFGYATADHNALLCGLLAVGLQIVINQIFDNVVMPRIVGHKVGMHPLLVMFALMAGFELWGILGMLVAVPLAGSIKIAIQHTYPAFRPAPSEDDTAEPVDEAEKALPDGRDEP